MGKVDKELERLCFERDAYHCRHCGTTKNLRIFSINDKLVSLSSLFTLCESCRDKSQQALQYDNNRVGVILCGGKGTRLSPITRTINKHLLPIGGVLPAVFYPLKTLRFFGVNRVLVVLDRDNIGAMMEVLGSGAEFGMDISYKVQEGAGGISDALYLAKDFADKDSEILCILGDNIFDRSSLDSFDGLDKDKACVWIKEVENPSAYGVASIRHNRVEFIEEKPQKPKSNLAVVGLYAYTYDVFGVIETLQPSDRGELEITSVNNYFAERGELKFKHVKGYWGDMGGSPSRYAECSMHGAKEANISAEEIDLFKSVVFKDK